MNKLITAAIAVTMIGTVANAAKNTSGTGTGNKPPVEKAKEDQKNKEDTRGGNKAETAPEGVRFEAAEIGKLVRSIGFKSPKSDLLAEEAAIGVVDKAPTSLNKGSQYLAPEVQLVRDRSLDALQKMQEKLAVELNSAEKAKDDKLVAKLKVAMEANEVGKERVIQGLEFHYLKNLEPYASKKEGPALDALLDYVYTAGAQSNLTMLGKLVKTGKLEDVQNYLKLMEAGKAIDPERSAHEVVEAIHKSFLEATGKKADADAIFRSRNELREKCGIKGNV